MDWSQVKSHYPSSISLAKVPEFAKPRKQNNCVLKVLFSEGSLNRCIRLLDDDVRTVYLENKHNDAAVSLCEIHIRVGESLAGSNLLINTHAV